MGAMCRELGGGGGGGGEGEAAVTWKQDPADHARDDPQEEGEDLEDSGQHTATLHVRHVPRGQTPLDHDLTTHG